MPVSAVRWYWGLRLEGKVRGHQQGRSIEKDSIVAASGPDLVESTRVDRILAGEWGIHHYGLR
jgi:hypothetical protein